MKTLKICIFALVSLLMSGMHQEARGQGCNPVLTSVNIMNRPSYCMTNAGDQVKLEIQWAMSTNDLTCVAPTNSWAIKIDMPTSFVYRVTSLADIVIGGPFTWTYDGFNNSLRGVNNVPIEWGMSGTVEVMLKGNSPLHTTCVDLSTVVNIQIIANPPVGNGSTANFDNDTGDDSGIFSLEVRQPMVVSTVPIAACYATEAAALAAALAATTVTTTCLGTVTKTAVKTGADCAATITVTAVNDCGNTQSVTYSTRIDNTAPVITAGTIASCYPTAAAAEAAALLATSATDDCIVPVIYAASTTGTCEAIVTVTATDGCGNVSSTSYNTRIDNTAPVITAGTIASCYPTAAAADAAALLATSATDVCSGAITYAASTTGTCEAMVTVTATDGCGNVSSTTYNTRIDNTAPVITAGSIAACYPTAALAEAAALLVTSATDVCSGAITYAASTTGTCEAMVTVTATDGCGNVSSTTYNTRIDNTAPVITAGSIAACYPTAALAEAAALLATSATDVCSGAITYAASTTGTCEAMVAVTATDGCGNVSSTTYNTRIDNTLPVITCKSPMTRNTNGGVCTYTVSGTEFDVTATDICSGAITYTYTLSVATTAGPVTGSLAGVVLNKGVTTVSWIATDGCGNVTAPCIFTVTVNDMEAPYVASVPVSGASVTGYMCGDTRTFNAEPNSCSATRSIIKPVWADNCVVISTSTASAGAVTLSDFGTFVSGTFPVGMTTVTFTGTDPAGNAGTCTLIIHIVDNQDPVITGCPTNIVIPEVLNACTQVVTWTAPTFFDNCGFTVTQTSSPTSGLTSGSAFPVGIITTITYTVMDPSGRTVTCIFTVEVEGTCNPPTEFTTTFVIESSGFSTGQSRTGVYTVDNISGSANTSPVQILITVPETSFSSGTGPLNRIPTVNTSVTLFGNTFMSNNGDWDYDLTFYPIIICTLKPGKVINPGQSSILAITFNAITGTGSTGQTTGQLLFGTAGDQNYQNNFAQSTFLIN